MEEASFPEEVLRPRLSRFDACLARAAARPGEKEIHDLRVSIRRLLAVLSVTASLLEEDDFARGTRKRLKGLMEPLGRLRDAQVKLLWLKKAVPVGDEPSYLFALSVASDEERWKERVVRTLRAVDPRRFRLPRWSRGFPHLPEPGLRERATTLLHVRREAVEALREEAAQEGNPEALHRMRLAFKRYRYSAEVFAPLFPRVTGETLARLHAFQTRLGDLHDFDVILSEAARFHASVLRRDGDFTVLSRFRELRRREFAGIEPILSVRDGLARHVFGMEFGPATSSGHPGSSRASSRAPSRETPPATRAGTDRGEAPRPPPSSVRNRP